MTKFVVTDHAHHADEGVYRLVFAESVEVVEHVEIPNPAIGSDEFDTDLPPTVIEERSREVLVHHQDVIWADDDERWQGRTPEDIATEQRKIVSDLLTQRAAEAERAEMEAAAARKDLGGVGQVL